MLAKVAVAALALVGTTVAAAAQQGRLDAGAIGEAAGTEATTTDDGVVRIGWKRDGVPVVIDGMPFDPAAGLGSWAAFKTTDQGAMVMGDTVVFQDEVTPAMDARYHGISWCKRGTCATKKSLTARRRIASGAPIALKSSQLHRSA